MSKATSNVLCRAAGAYTHRFHTFCLLWSSWSISLLIPFATRNECKHNSSAEAMLHFPTDFMHSWYGKAEVFCGAPVLFFISYTFDKQYKMKEQGYLLFGSWGIFSLTATKTLKVCVGLLVCWFYRLCFLWSSSLISSLISYATNHPCKGSQPILREHLDTNAGNPQASG
jgi:hypothetical protein